MRTESVGGVCRSALMAAVAVVGLLAMAPAHSQPKGAVGSRPAPTQVEPFEVGTLQQWQSTMRRPTWVAFTATWCAVCPAVIADLSRMARQHPRQPLVWTVVIDVPPGEDDLKLLTQEHLRSADRVFAFEGLAQAIRHSVDPAWRGSVPHVALMEPGGPMRLFSGRPPPAELAR